jgi:hypothetical protein
LGRSMEIPIYDTVPRRLGAFLIPVLFIPSAVIYATFPTGRTQGRNVPDDMMAMLSVLALLAAGASLALNLMMNVWVRIDAGSGNVFRLHKLLGRTVRTREYAVAQFDHISLHRAPRGGYLVTLVGHERKLRLRFTADLKRAREIAREAAACSGLELKDQV